MLTVYKHVNTIFAALMPWIWNMERKNLDKRFIGILVSATFLPYYDLLTERTSAKGPPLQLEERRCHLIIRNMQIKNKKASI